jgi:hypothetical protein
MADARAQSARPGLSSAGIIELQVDAEADRGRSACTNDRLRRMRNVAVEIWRQSECCAR